MHLLQILIYTFTHTFGQSLHSPYVPVEWMASCTCLSYSAQLSWRSFGSPGTTAISPSTRQSTDDCFNTAVLFVGSSVTNLLHDKVLIVIVAICVLVGILLFILIGCLRCCHRDEEPCWQGRRMAGSPVLVEDEESCQGVSATRTEPSW